MLSTCFTSYVLFRRLPPPEVRSDEEVCPGLRSLVSNTTAGLPPYIFKRVKQSLQLEDLEEDEDEDQDPTYRVRLGSRAVVQEQRQSSRLVQVNNRFEGNHNHLE